MSGNGAAPAAGQEGFLVGVDIGGTFTDCVIIGPDGEIRTGKVPTRPEDRASSFFDSIEEAAAGFGLSRAAMLARTERIVHGTTTGTNALITRGGAKTGLLTSAGHRDMTFLMKGSGRLASLAPDQVMNLPSTDKPEPLVSRRLIGEVGERVDFEGEVIAPLDEEMVRECVAALREQDVDAIAVSLLWSVRNGDHEERIAALVRELAPGVFVSTASELSARVGEYERTMTAVINGYIGPLMERYVDAIEQGARDGGYAGRVLYSQCAGGAITAEEAKAAPIRTVHSGPVSGTLGSSYLAERMGEADVIVADMGGTSFDVSIVRGSVPDVREVSELARFEVALPMVYVDTVGAGGGSIAWVDERGGLQVGPQSAGAFPGPACYGRGGTEPAVTDADVVLGIIDPQSFLHGEMELDRDAAERAVKGVADQLGLGVTETAAGINRIIDSRMADLLRRMSVMRGLDPRDFACFAYGGGGPVHVPAVARDVGVRRLIIPLVGVSPVWSAFGAAIAEVSHVHQDWATIDLPAEPARIEEAFARLEQAAVAGLRDEGFGDENIVLRRSVRMKYVVQMHDVDVPVEKRIETEGDVARLEDDFARIYDEIHGAGSGFREGGAQVTAVNLRANGVSERPPVRAAAAAAAPSWGSRQVFWEEAGEFRETPVCHLTGSIPGEHFEGPVLFELPDTVVAVRPGQRASFDEHGSIVIDL